MVGLLEIHLHLTNCHSLKEKRGLIKPFISRLRREFNVSVAEVDAQDSWHTAILLCGMVGNDTIHLEQSLQTITRWVEGNWPDGDVSDQKIEIIK
jgi:uncharacterized protein YlxP (DUF503 family)